MGTHNFSVICCSTSNFSVKPGFGMGPSPLNGKTFLHASVYVNVHVDADVHDDVKTKATVDVDAHAAVDIDVDLYASVCV